VRVVCGMAGGLRTFDQAGMTHMAGRSSGSGLLLLQRSTGTRLMHTTPPADALDFLLPARRCNV